MTDISEENDLEYFKLNDPEYYNDFLNLKKDSNGAIIMDEYCISFLKKYFHIRS